MPILFSKRVFTVLFAMLTVVFYASAGESAVQLKRVVIDAGHGGRDPGAISHDGKLKEKTVVLDVALSLGKRIKEAYPAVDVIYTRSTDVFIPLDKRADIANKNHADLFISIHCNAVKSQKPSGFETYVMGMDRNDANMAVCKRENSVILLEDDYSTKYQGFDPNDTESYIFFNLMQNAYFEQSLIFAELCQKEMGKGPIKVNRGIKQGALVVLWRSTMPSVLVELGFISNASDNSVLSNKTQRDALAGDLFAAFKKFKEQYENGLEVEQENGAAVADTTAGSQDVVADNTPTAADMVGSRGDTFYAVQIFALSKELASDAPQFKGEKNIHRFKAGNVFKYTAGQYGTEAEAAAAAVRLNDKFPGCFVVKIDNFEIKKK